VLSGVSSGEDFEHARVAEGVGLHPREVEELGDALVRRAGQLGEYLRVDDAFARGQKAVALEERHLEGEAEQAVHTEVERVAFELFEDGATDAAAEPRVIHRESAHFGEVFPHHVQGAASDGRSVLVFRDAEFLHRFVEDHEVFAEQDALLHERLDEPLDEGDVGCSGPAHREAHAFESKTA
jgi:hypothetical protein